MKPTDALFAWVLCFATLVLVLLPSGIFFSRRYIRHSSVGKAILLYGVVSIGAIIFASIGAMIVVTAWSKSW